MTPQAALWLVCVATEAVALGLAVALAWRSSGVIFRDSRQPNSEQSRAVHLALARKRGELFLKLFRSPLVRLLLAGLVIDLTVGFVNPDRTGWGLAVLAASGPRPRLLVPRLAYHAADAVWLAWPLAMAWTTCRVFGPQKTSGPGLHHRAEPSSGPQLTASREGCVTRVNRPQGEPAEGTSRAQAVNLPAPLLGLYLGAVVALAACYPLPHGATQRALLVVELACLATTARAVYLGRRAPWGIAHRVLVVLAFFEATLAIVGPFARDVFRSWPIVGAAVYSVAFAVVAVMLGRELRRGGGPGHA